MMQIKSGVHIKSVDQAMGVMLLIVLKVFDKYNYDAIITSANDGTHMVGSKHYIDSAYDFRSHHIANSATKHTIFNEIKINLGELYDCVFEYEGLDNEHFHIEIH